MSESSFSILQRTLSFLTGKSKSKPSSAALPSPPHHISQQKFTLAPAATLQRTPFIKCHTVKIAFVCEAEPVHPKVHENFQILCNKGKMCIDITLLSLFLIYCESDQCMMMVLLSVEDTVAPLWPWIDEMMRPAAP